MLDSDVCNNSAWSYRYFIIMKTNKQFGKELVNNEIDYAIKKRLHHNLTNESVWVYMRGMLAISREEAEDS